MDTPAPRVVVGVNGSADRLRALRRAVAEAGLRNAVLVAVLACIPAGGEAIARDQSGRSWSAAMVRCC